MEQLSLAHLGIIGREKTGLSHPHELAAEEDAEFILCSYRHRPDETMPPAVVGTQRLGYVRDKQANRPALPKPLSPNDIRITDSD